MGFGNLGRVNSTLGNNTDIFTTTDANGNVVDANGNIVQPASGGTTESMGNPAQSTTQSSTTPSSMFVNGSLGKQITDQMSGPAGGVVTIGPGTNNQVQGGAQAGTFQSNGTQAQQQSGLTSQDTTSGQTGTTFGQQSTQQDQRNVGSQSNVGQENQQTNNTGTSVANTANTGNTTTNINDSLGLGKLLSNQAGMAQATDQNRNAALTDIMQNGDSSMDKQVGAAVNNALSGPGMQGVGDSAQARAAGYAAANVQRQNVADKLAAAQQLGGSTASTSLANAGNAYLGSSQNTSNTGTQQQATQNSGATNNQTSSQGTNNSNSVGSSNTNNASTSNQNATSSSLGSSLSSLLGSNSSSGTSAAQNAQAAYGTTPAQQTSSGGGGSVICSVLGEYGWIPHWILVAELVHVKKNANKFWYAAKGYLLWGQPVARLARKNKLVALMCLPFAKALSYEAARRANNEMLEQHVLPKFITPMILYYLFLWINTLIGLFIPGAPRVTNPELQKLLSDSNLELDFGGAK